MKYKVGDKVKIVKDSSVRKECEEDIQKLNTNRIVTIKEVMEGTIIKYKMKEFEEPKFDTEWQITEDHIEGLVTKKEDIKVLNRFELMDFD